MGLTSAGKKVLKMHRNKYGKSGDGLFFSALKKQVPGSELWYERKSKASKFTESLKARD